MGLFTLLQQIETNEHLEEIKNQLKMQQSFHNPENNKTESLIRNLQDNISSLYLINYALIELLQDKGIIDTETMKQKMDEIDLRDGKKDGKIEP
ncbi:MAG: hypothetical protein V1709_08110 [Planctomycetota bacterium]